VKKISEGQKELYSKKYCLFGDNTKSLLWNNQESQFLRFSQLAQLFQFENSNRFSVHEIGCGLAHFKDFLDSQNIYCQYSGSDIVPDFIKASKKKYPPSFFTLQDISVDFNKIKKRIRGKDYYCLSGTFYTKEDNSIRKWESFVFKSMENMFRMAKKGVAFNFLTSYSTFYDKKLYYANPGKIMNWCNKKLSRFIILSHNIPLYEFTVFLYKKEFIKKNFPQKSYGKYFK